jgi:hypothetical protein
MDEAPYEMRQQERIEIVAMIGGQDQRACERRVLQSDDVTLASGRKPHGRT